MSILVFVYRLGDMRFIAWMPRWMAVLGICSKSSHVILIVLEHSFLRLLCNVRSPKGSYTVS